MEKHGKRESKPTTKPISTQQEEILRWLKTTRFKRALLGGLDERDVWKKLGDLNALYEAAILAERARYDTLLQEYKGRTEDHLTACKKALEESEQRCDRLLGLSLDPNNMTESAL